MEKDWGKQRYQTRRHATMPTIDTIDDGLRQLLEEEIRKGTLIGLVNNIATICAKYRDYGGGQCKNSLFDLLPIIAVVGGQSSGKSSLLERLAGIEFLPKTPGFVRRTPLVVHLQKDERLCVQFGHRPHGYRKQTFFFDLSKIRHVIEDQTNRNYASNLISPPPLHIFIYSPNVINNLHLIDLPALTSDNEKMVKTYIDKPNCIILAVSPAGQDLAKSDVMKLAKEVDPLGGRTIGVLTKLDLVDEGTHALDVLEGRSYPVHIPWVGVAIRPPHHDNTDSMGRRVLTKLHLIDKHALDARDDNTDMMMRFSMSTIERTYFAKSPHYAHLARRMGSEYLANLLLHRLGDLINYIDIDSLRRTRIRELEADPKPDQTMLMMYKSTRIWALTPFCL